MYHVLVLVLTLAGQVVGVFNASGANNFPTLEACSAARVERMADTQAELERTPQLAGKYVVARGNCFSDDQIKQMQNQKPPVEERGA